MMLIRSSYYAEALSIPKCSIINDIILIATFQVLSMKKQIYVIPSYRKCDLPGMIMI